jgi:hypothetical protein
MKTVDLSAETPTLNELLQLAENESVILRTPQGREFVIAEVEDFDQEIAQTLKNGELMRLLDERSKEPGVHSLKQVREKLNLE